MVALSHPQQAAEPYRRNELGQFAEVPTFGALNRYIRDPQFRAEMDAARVREQQRLQIELDRFALQTPAADDEAGWVSAARERVAEWEKFNG